MKNIFKNWSKFEIFLLVFSPIIIIVVGLIFASDFITISTAVLGVICALFLAKGLVVGHIIGIVLVVFYSILSYKNSFYGEMLIYLFIMLPMYVWGIYSWLKHKNKENNFLEVNSIKKIEWIIVSFVSIIIYIVFYFILKSMNTNELFISTLSIVDNIFAIYLLARRSKYGFVSYIINDLILIILWGIPVISGNLLLFPMMLNPLANLVNDIYGVVYWSKMQKNQSL